MFAVLDGQTVVQMFPTKPTLHAGIQVIDASSDPSVAVDWTYVNGVFSPPASSTPPTKDQLNAYAATKRFNVETGGITINGAQIDTNRDSQGLIVGAYNFAQANPAVSIAFKSARGWVTLTADEIVAVAMAVASHVQASFAAEQIVDAAISNGSIKYYAQIETAAWPTNNS